MNGGNELVEKHLAEGELGLMTRRPRRRWRRPRLLALGLVGHLLVIFVLEPLPHCMNGGGELVRCTMPRDSYAS